MCFTVSEVVQELKRISLSPAKRANSKGRIRGVALRPGIDDTTKK